MTALIILTVLGVFLLVWLVGFAVFSYHVFSYGSPGDATKKVFYIFLSISIITLLVSAFFIASVNWGAL